MPLLVSRVFRDEVEVFAADDQGAMHFGGDDSASKDTASDRHFTSERALFV